MVPETLASLLAFLAFVAPGLTFELLRERRRPFIEESAFREASRIGLTSVVFSGAALLLLAVLRAWRPGWVVDPGAWLAGGSAYAAANLDVVGRTVLIQLALAIGLALVVDGALLRRRSGRIVTGGVWFTLFRRRRPPGSHTWVHVRLADETDVWGYADDYTAEHSLENRELVVAGPQLQYRLKGETGKRSLGDWSFLAVRGDQIVWMKVAYTDDRTGGVVPAVYPAGGATAAWTRVRRWIRRGAAPSGTGAPTTPA